MIKETYVDAQVEALSNRPLDGGPYAFVWMDALTIKEREAGRTVNVHALVAVGVNADGGREVLGLDVASTEDGAGWLAFLRSLTARGLSGVRLVVSDAHRGLVDAIGATLPAASWQRCRTHYLRNLLTKAPKSAQPWVATMVRTIFDQPDAAPVREQFRRVVDTITARFPDAATHLDDARDDLLTVSVFPHEIWRQIWSNNPQERLNKEIRRRTDVVGVFPNRAAIIRLVGAVLAEQTDQWTEQRRYVDLEILSKARLTLVTNDVDETTTTVVADNTAIAAYHQPRSPRWWSSTPLPWKRPICHPRPETRHRRDRESWRDVDKPLNASGPRLSDVTATRLWLVRPLQVSSAAPFSAAVCGQQTQRHAAEQDNDADNQEPEYEPDSCHGQQRDACGSADRWKLLVHLHGLAGPRLGGVESSCSRW